MGVSDEHKTAWSGETLPWSAPSEGTQGVRAPAHPVAHSTAAIQNVEAMQSAPTTVAFLIAGQRVNCARPWSPRGGSYEARSAATANQHRNFPTIKRLGV